MEEGAEVVEIKQYKTMKQLLNELANVTQDDLIPLHEFLKIVKAATSPETLKRVEKALRKGDIKEVEEELRR